MKRIVSFILTVTMLIGMLPMAVWAEEVGGVEPVAIANGACGENLFWEIDGSTATLIISGTGAMDDFIIEEDNGIYYPGTSPWYDYKDQIRHVIIEEGVTTIGHCAFSLSPVVEEVIIPEGITSIGEWAFDDCLNLKTITLPDSLKTIEQFAFSGAGLTEINIPDSVTKLGGSSFLKCSDLANVELSNNITEIPRGAFAHCAFTHFEIPSSVTVIGSDAFYNCTALTSIVIPESVTTIMDFAFSDCIGIKSITFEGNAPEFSYDDIEEQSSAFENVAATAYYPGNNSTWTEAVMQNYGGTITWVASEEHSHVYGDDNKCTCGAIGGICGDNLTWMLSSDGVLMISGTGKMTNFSDGPFVPWYENRESIISIQIEDGATSLGSHAFANCVYLTSISIPESVISIGDYTFFGCKKLNSISLPESITSIGNNSFGHCEQLSSISIPEGITSISHGAFFVCSNLSSISIPKSVASIEDYAFYHCKSLSNVSIPDGVTYIGNNAFKECSSLTSISIPNGVTSIGDHTFSECTDLKNINISEGITSIGRFAFSSCTSLTSIIIPDSVTKIGANAFDFCVNITNISLPCGITEIPDFTFASCFKLSDITIPDTVTKIGECAFFECFDLTSINIPDGVTQIGREAFYGTGLKHVDLPDSVVSLGQKAFCINNLKSISLSRNLSIIPPELLMGCEELSELILHDNIKEIGTWAFCWCSSLEEITIPASVNKLGHGVFLNCGALKTIKFLGDAPDFPTSDADYGEEDLFGSVSAIVYYPANNATWTQDVMQDYGGDITWVPYDPELDEDDSENIEEITCKLNELTPLDYIAFSSIAYKDFSHLPTLSDTKTIVTETIKDYFTKKGIWEALWEETDIAYKELYDHIANWKLYRVAKNDKTGYYAVVFKNDRDEAVIAYRGSGSLIDAIIAFIKNDTDEDAYLDWFKNDLPIMFENRIGEQLDDAIETYDKLVEIHNIGTIETTGHSLGGALGDIVSAYSGCEGNTVNAVPALDAAYRIAIDEMAAVFSGVDRWNFRDHVNQYDRIAGMIEEILSTSIKPYISYKCADSSVEENHSIKSLVEKDDENNVIIREKDSTFIPQKPISNYMTFVGESIDFGSSENDRFNKGLSVAVSRTSYGGDGADEIVSSIWADTLIGGKGIDNLDGNWGNDTYIYCWGHDADIIRDVSGHDTLKLLGVTSKADVNFVVDDASDFVDVYCDDTLIARVARKNRAELGHSFMVEWDGVTTSLSAYLMQKNYSAHINIGCPVDIQIVDADGNVVYIIKDGELGNFYTDYGNFYVYEEEDGGYGKALDLLEGYTINIVGVGTGTMDISYQSVENGELSAAKTLSEVPVTSTYEATLGVTGNGEIQLHPSTGVIHTSHTSGTDWASDATTHWHECTGCDEKLDLNTHSGGVSTCTKKAICTVCGTSYGEFASHNYESSWSQGDANGHWHECKNCSAHDAQVKHTPGAAATETTAQFCTVCDYVITPALGHACAAGSKWYSNGTYHWHVCTSCSAWVKTSYHSYSSDTDETCNVCGYTRTVTVTDPTVETEAAMIETTETTDYGEEVIATETTPTIVSTKTNENLSDNAVSEDTDSNGVSGLLITAFVIVALGSLAALLILLVYKKRHESE